MTTIAYRDGVLAADGRATCDGFIETDAELKIWRKGSILFGACGSCLASEAFRTWTLAGMPADHTFGTEADDGNAIAIMPDGLILTWNHKGVWKTRAPFYAIGSGGNHATGAMAHGATAVEAVRAAIMVDTRSGGNILVLRH